MKNSVTKRIFSVLLTAILLLGTLPALSLPTFAASESDLTFTLTYDGVSYIVSDCNEKASGELVIPNKYDNKPVTAISDSAFEDCTGLTSVTIPGSIKSIGYSSFYNCTGLTTVVMSEGVTELRAYSFGDCTGLKSIYLPDSVTEMGESPFAGCSNLEKIEVSPGNTRYSSQDGILFNKDKSWLENFPEGKKCAFYEIPQTVTLIGQYAFSGATFSAIAIPDSVSEIGRGAFAGCENLISIEIPGKVTVLNETFSGCTNLKKVVLPEGLTEINYFAFSHCANLEEVVIPESLQWIGTGAFDGCMQLNDIYIPKNVKKMSSFGSCGIKTIYGCKGSYAEEYASENGYEFVAIADLKNREFNISVKGEVDYTAALEVKLLSSDKSKITYDITLTKDGKAIQPDGTVTVKIPVPESLDGAKCRVYRVEENGKNTDMNAEFKDGFMVFKTTHFSKYILTTDDLSVVYGDINGDGKINTVDLAMLRKYLANKDPATGESSVSVGAGADVNGDGKINTVDLALLRKYLANKDPVTGESSVTLGPR